VRVIKIDVFAYAYRREEMDTNTCKELIVLCRERGIKGYSGKKRADLLDLLRSLPQDTGKSRTNKKDQFYTNDRVAASCVQRIIDAVPLTRDYLWVEPSAGNGAFLRPLPASCSTIGLDIDPKAKGILLQDYLAWQPPAGKIIVFGNPPFGRQSSLAKAFISKSCEFATVVAFILPKSFTKPSMYRAFDKSFHLLQSVELEKNSFVVNGLPYDVPCVFQIWQKGETDRLREEKIEPRGFDYVKPTEPYHIAFRRVGGLAGKCYKHNGTAFSVQSHYFLTFHEDAMEHMDAIIERINQHIFPSNTVGPRSLSKSEVNQVINAILVEALRTRPADPAGLLRAPTPPLS
jgi:hypothetical protein